MIHVADLHCDLLAYLVEKEGRTINDEECRCALPQFKKGNVFFQTLAVYTETGKKSVSSAEKQLMIFQHLPHLYQNDFERMDKLALPSVDGKIHIIASIENASGLCDETENLDHCFTRFDTYREKAGPIFYISLTWNHENRFGGGNHSKVGLKRDGELLLEYLHGQRIAIDLSHTSDELAHDILNYIDKKGLRITPIASHSNFRKISNQLRNLPDDVAKEIFHRGGIIGMNFVKIFVGKNYPEDFSRQIDYGRSLGGFDQICIGADFFYDKDTPVSVIPFIPFFHEPFGNSSCYPDYFNYLNDFYTKDELMKIAHENLANFFERLYATSR